MVVRRGSRAEPSSTSDLGQHSSCTPLVTQEQTKARRTRKLEPRVTFVPTLYLSPGPFGLKILQRRGNLGAA
jgi:hypothetical protein